MKSLTKSVEDRYQSAAAMRADIERFLAGKPVVAPVVPVAGDDDFVPARRVHHAVRRRTATTSRDEEEPQEAAGRWC